ncbi:MULTISPECIES: hypothetical protein [unclassified Prevotella]|uniref:hypothetical protein n=1 Tax=unclassified Prevotella TaxID=2638335 RepID=UPI00048AC01B|nr:MULTISPECIES: hypothetical protein [unclassified Prevotella]
MTLEYLEITEDMKKWKKQRKRQVATVPPAPPDGKPLLNQQRLKVLYEQNSRLVTVYQRFEVNSLKELRQELYRQTSEIDKCFVINNNLLTRERD